MKNVLIFACLAGIASAIAIYFVGESYKTSDAEKYLTGADI